MYIMMQSAKSDENSNSKGGVVALGDPGQAEPPPNASVL